MTLTSRAFVVLASSALAGSLVAGCGSSSGGSGSSGLSMSAKLSTVTVCAQVASDLKDVAVVAEQLATQKISQTDAVNKLQPIEKSVSTTGSQNASLPVGKALTQLGTDITAVTKVNTGDTNALTQAAKTLLNDGKSILSDCAAVRH